MTDAGGRSSLGAITQHNPPPNNALYIEFHQSDGESSRWPQPCPGPSRDSDGKLNYYRPIGLDEHASTDWRKKIGFKVAELMKKPNAELYYLSSWPEGYGLFVHIREQVSNGLLRHDLYLHGAKQVLRFRSANEFIPHAYWLLTSSTLNKGECACKYCAKKKNQTDVNEKVLGEYSRSFNLSSQAKARPKRREKGSYEPSTSSRPTNRQESRYKPPKFRLPLSLNDSSIPYTARTRHAELHESRMIRDGELVWIPLVKSIEHPDQPSIKIEFWPAFALDVNYEKEVHVDIDPELLSVSEKKYIVTRPLTAGATNVHALESTVLPFRAWEVDMDLITVLRNTKPPKDFDPYHTEAVFHPHGNRGELAPDISFERIAPYYTLAVQMAGHMDSYWSPMFQIDAGLPGSSGAFFQGLWLGAERIWLEDLVRLIPDHDELMTHHELRNKLSAPDQGSETRSLFMRINEIIVDDIITLDGPRKVCRISGPLFCCVPDPEYSEEHLGPKTLSIAQKAGVNSLINFPMPAPPIGFQYLPLTQPESEIILDGMMIAGRYYPKLLLNSSLNITWIQDHSESWWWTLVAMSGLAAGRYARSNAQYLMRKRKEAAEMSERAARSDLTCIWSQIGQVEQPRSDWMQQ